MVEGKQIYMIESHHSSYGLENHGFRNLEQEHWNLNVPALYEQAIRRHEGVLAYPGALVVRTGDYTGRSPDDKFTVCEPSTEKEIWWGTINRETTQAEFNKMHQRISGYFENRDIFVQDCYAGADPLYRLPIRIITEHAWQSLFARNMFVTITDSQSLNRHVPEFTVISAPGVTAVPGLDPTSSGAFILVNFARKMALIGGTLYAGEIKKSIFTVMNYLMPKRSVMAMHCSANYGRDPDDVAIFFGLSGTGKTTLSNDATRTLIGDDEHGWSDKGIFNFEGGCYAKVIRLSEEGEPEIYRATRKFGTVIENVKLDAHSRRIDFDDDDSTENTRAAYPLTHVEKADYDGIGGHPRHIIFLTADAFGVIPPIASLTPAHAQYHFLAGYTAKVAGTEEGVREPTATFSTCFGAPFMPLHPTVYATLLAERINMHNAKIWMVNTGWTGGPYGKGERMKLSFTRAMVRAALEDKLDNVKKVIDPVFGFKVPTEVPGVPAKVLVPRNTWDDPSSYDTMAKDLAARFQDYMVQFEDKMTDEVKAAAPRA